MKREMIDLREFLRTKLPLQWAERELDREIPSFLKAFREILKNRGKEGTPKLIALCQEDFQKGTMGDVLLAGIALLYVNPERIPVLYVHGQRERIEGSPSVPIKGMSVESILTQFYSHYPSDLLYSPTE